MAPRLLPKPCNRTSRAFGVVFALLSAVLGYFATARASDSADKPVFEEWVVVVLDNKTLGYGSTITKKTGSDFGTQYVTAYQQEFSIKREGAMMKITDMSKVTEDADGGVLSFTQTSSAGSSVESSGVRDGDYMVVTSRGQTQRFLLPRLSALGPEAIRRQTNAVPLKAGQPYSLNTFSTEYPQGVVVEKGKVVQQESRDVRGVKRDLWKLTSEVSLMPGLLSTMWVDSQANEVEAVTVQPGIGALHEYVTDRAECMKQPEGAELFTTSLIHPDRALPSPHDQGQAVYRLIPLDPGRRSSCGIRASNAPLPRNPARW